HLDLAAINGVDTVVASQPLRSCLALDRQLYWVVTPR
ncbi:MAG: hypothetical protein RLZ42_1154, partial [Armatimonadota bacterium]